MTNEEIKNECYKRLKKIVAYEPVLEAFKNDETIFISENPSGAVFTLTNDEKKIVDKIESDYHCKVYMVIRAMTNMGIDENYLYVSGEGDWEEEHTLLDRGQVYVFNRSQAAGYFIEHGLINIAIGSAGAPIRKFGLL